MAVSRPWVTPKDVKDYTEQEDVKNRPDEKLAFDITSGSETVTCVGCVPTGDINLIEMDTDGDVVKESITFGAKRIV